MANARCKFGDSLLQIKDKSKAMVNMLMTLINSDPRQRPSARVALEGEWFNLKSRKIFQLKN